MDVSRNQSPSGEHKIVVLLWVDLENYSILVISYEYQEQNLNPRPKLLEPKTLNPKPYPLNPKPQTSNP